MTKRADMGEPRVWGKEEWVEALRALEEQYRIYVPVKEGDFHVFRSLDRDAEPDFGYQNTRLSPKSLIFPQSERMFEYSLERDEEDAGIVKEASKRYVDQAIVGIRPCDAHAFELVGVNFDNPEYRDPWWVNRFESTVLVGLGCNDPCETCFCTSVGGGPFSERGLDALLYDLGDRFLLKGLRERGDEFMKRIKGGKKAQAADLEEAEEIASEAPGKISSQVPTDRLAEKDARELFEAPFWEHVAFSCIGCGTCTFLCPTCWCFDIQDEVAGVQGDRIRNWDSCMFPLFTLHGSGHDPRALKFQRVRQRFMHKLKYYGDKYQNGVLCSGCGRCIRSCPVNIDIREVCRLMDSY